MEDGNLAILVDAKTEYTKQLVGILSPFIYNGIKRIYFEAKEECFERDSMENTLRTFQLKLSEIPKWNQEVIDTECSDIISESKCDYLEDLIMAVFVSHTRILTSINFSKNKNKVNLKIPKVDHFIHQCYIEAARSFWKNPYLFDDTINKYEFQRNRREAETMIEKQIGETIRRQLPVKNILKEYLGNEYKEIEDAEEEVENDQVYNNNLRKLVKAEIENCSKEKLDKFNIENESFPQEELETDELETEELETEELETEELEPEPEEESNNLDILEVVDTPVTNKQLDPEQGEEVDLASNEREVKATLEPTPKVVGDSIGLVAKSGTTIEESPINLKSSKIEPVNLDNLESMSDNEIENQEVTNIIDKEVAKLAIEPLDNGLNIEELDLDIDDLSLLEAVYQDEPRPITPISLDEQGQPSNKINDEENIKLDIKELDILNSPMSESSLSFANSNHTSNVEESEESPPVKTIILDTKKRPRRIVNDSNNLEINDFEDDEASDSEIEEKNKMKQKVYNRYSKNRDYSFFN
jgi:hypothetical protein